MLGTVQKTLQSLSSVKRGAYRAGDLWVGISASGQNRTFNNRPRVSALWQEHPADSPPLGVVTLSEIGPIWTINQQAKSLKSLASTLAIVGKFRSV